LNSDDFNIAHLHNFLSSASFHHAKIDNNLQKVIADPNKFQGYAGHINYTLK